MKLRIRFSLVILGLILLGQGIYSGTYYHLERQSALADMYRDARASVRLAATLCHEAAVTGNWDQPKGHFIFLQKSPAVRYADCLDNKGLALAHSDPRQVGVVQQLAMSHALAGVWEVSHSIRIPGGKFGLARIGYDTAVLDEGINERLLRTLWRMALVASITLLFGLLAAVLVALTLTRPVEALAEATREISVGNLEYRLADEGRQDELGTLGRRFNEMAERLGELSRMKEQVVSSLTHDLKNPLAGIKGAVETMLAGEAGPLTEKQRKYLESSLSSAQRLWGYLDDILDVMRLQSGQFPMKLEPVEVAQFADPALDGQRAKAKECGLRLEADIPADIPAVRADRELARRVLDNLIANAVKFTPKGGGITVHAERDGDYVRFAVRDTGAGIPADKADKVFEDFYQVDETKAQARERGTGMGLAICRRIVEEHGGRIWVESVLGEGSVFFFTLPVVLTTG
ncbi:MAG: HAMP domain-containing sensor histidine kinase [Elusimicrobiota bacterium]